MLLGSCDALEHCGEQQSSYMSCPQFDGLLSLQYVGSVLSIWGGVILAFHQSPPGLVALATYWSLLYLITGAVEQFL